MVRQMSLETTEPLKCDKLEFRDRYSPHSRDRIRKFETRIAERAYPHPHRHGGLEGFLSRKVFGD